MFLDNRLYNRIFLRRIFQDIGLNNKISRYGPNKLENIKALKS